MIRSQLNWELVLQSHYCSTMSSWKEATKLESVKVALAPLRERISLKWGAHRHRNDMAGSIVSELILDNNAPIQSVKDPIIDSVVHTHIFQPRSAYVLRNVIFDPATGNVSLHGRILRESEPDDFSGIIQVRIPRRIVSSKDSIIWGIRPSTYYHWMLEELPALIVGLRLEPELSVFHLAPIPKFVLESTAALGIKVKESPRLLKASRLLLIDRGKDSGWPRPANVAELARCVDGLIKTQKPSAKIFISRAGCARPGANVFAAEALALKRGYEVHRFHDLAWLEQLRVMRRAKRVVANHGAGLANIVAMNRGSEVCEVMSPEYSNPVYEILSETLSLTYESRVESNQDSRFWSSIFV